MDDFDDKYEEVQEKLRLLEEKLDELENVPDDNGLAHSEIVLDNSQFLVHWVSPEDAESFEDCDSIKNTRDAQKLFKEASVFRDKSENHKPVHHGDLLVLTCNRGEEIPIIVDGVEVVDTAAEKETNACYFVGMCVQTDGSYQEECPIDSDVTDKQEPCDETGPTLREFVAWDTCGSGASCEVEYDEDGNPLPAKSVEITEVTNPDSVEQADTLLKEYSQTEGSEEKLADVVTGLSTTSEDTLDESFFEGETNLLFAEVNPIVNGSTVDNPVALSVPHRDPSTITQKSVNTNLELKELKITEQVTTLAKKIINKIKLPFKKIKISSDECGNLTREPDPDEGSYDPDSEQEVLANVDGSEVGSLEIKSKSVSIGTESSDEGFSIDCTKIDIGSEVPTNMSYIIPNLYYEESKKIFRTLQIRYIEEVSLEEAVTVDKETDSENNIVTIKLKIEKSTLDFASGLVLQGEDLSEEILPITFNIPKSASHEFDWKEILICENGEEKCIKVPYKACDDG